MSSSLTDILYRATSMTRVAALICLGAVATWLIIADGAKDKLSPGKVLGIAASAVLAAILIWTLPTLINYARVDSERIVPAHPVGGYNR
ncbi:hypothetical protein JK358_35640 [Nocardia sp. 2]|uniref:Uncharacterized protein n=1 Tax=Nocardia acididurans TaxID=2802282 RepID=A0ABS1MKH2_9NOCA|nr:hypothetical protein [Nocardia acididurans]MBL1079748.1 hypothetical protein [Nocardia acididurans]